MTLSIGTARTGSLSMGTNTGMQGGSTPQSTTSPQMSVSPQSTWNPQQTVNPNNVYQGGGGTSYGYTAPAVAAPADPYARWGGQGAYTNMVNSFNSQKDNVFSSAREAAANSGIGLRGSILDLIDSVRTGQQAVDNRGINADMAKQRGTQDIYGMINRGVQSGGVTLANRNASDSSAAGAIAQAYGQLGQRQLSDVNNQYELENQDISLAQQNLDMQRASGLRKIEDSKEQVINSIVSDANNQLAAIDTAMANASLPDRIALDAEKNRIRSEVMGTLSQYDANKGDVNNVRAMDRNARISEATRRASLGQANPLQFKYQTEAPMQYQGSGPFASTLPIFTYRNGSEEQLA